MSIKKSSLEQKWYYRLAKIFFLILPLILIILFLLNKKTIACNIVPTNISDILQNSLVYIIVSLILYFLILKVLWKIFLYIAFGGMEEDDTQKKESEGARPVNPAESKAVKIVRLIAIIIILSAFAIFILSKMGYITPSGINTDLSGQDIKPTSTPGYTCPATSAQTGTPCHSANSGGNVMGQNVNLGTFGVVVPDKCNCPSDTKYAQMDNITAGGPYKICTCK